MPSTLIKNKNVINGNIPVNLNIKNGKEFLFISKDQRLYTHAIHKYPAKFFPELPRWAIKRYSRKGGRVIDPFMGSGTTNLEAMLLNRQSAGVDVDPFSRLLAKVKTTLLSPRTLMRASTQINAYLDQYKKAKPIKNIPSFPYRDHWFNQHVLHELAYIKNGIDEMIVSQKMKDFFMITFSAIIRQCSQADNHCTRTVIRKKLNKTVKPEYAINLFRKKLKNNVDGMLALLDSQTDGVKVDIPNNMSATDLHQYRDSSFHLAVTSPPYINAVDYPRTHQLELYWLGLASGSLQAMKKAHVGTEAVCAADYANLHKTGIDQADRLIKSIYAVDKRRAYIATKYILDMIANLKEVYRVLKTGGHYVMAVGSNSIRGHLFENWRYIKQAALDIGFDIDCVFVSGIINHFIKIPRKERISKDHILIMKKMTIQESKGKLRLQI